MEHSDTIDSDNGWLSPDGKFYGCQYHGHDALAYELLGRGSYHLEDLGYAKIQRHPLNDEFAWAWHLGEWEGRIKPTYIQKKMVVDYFMSRGWTHHLTGLWYDE